MSSFAPVRRWWRPSSRSGVTVRVSPAGTSCWTTTCGVTCGPPTQKSRASTRLYREIGDAVAFGAVMNHFDVLREEIAREGGSVVKTIGDAIMAVFPRPAPALRAITNAQSALASPPEGVRPLTVKAGLHAGPCIAVTLNERLDYFGSNVNIAARLEPLSTGEDCVITSDVRRDPEVLELLSDPASGLAAEPSEASLKGFDNESFELWRVKQNRER